MILVFQAQFFSFISFNILQLQFKWLPVLCDCQFDSQYRVNFTQIFPNDSESRVEF